MISSVRPRRRGLIASLRPRQWLKNLLVLSAPLASGRLFEAEVLVPALVGVVAFCGASSGVYLLNDILDREFDRLHPTKQYRPIAAGRVSIRAAAWAAVVLATAAIGVAWWVAPQLAALVGGYLAMQVAYCLWLKHERVLDLSIVAIGFLLRAVAGGVAADLPLTTPFLLVSGFGSLFIVAGKRFSELRALGPGARTRRALVHYSDTYLRFVWTMSAAATVLSYALWALEQVDVGLVLPWHAVSVAPFVIGVMLYAVDVDAGRAGTPEEIVWSDRRLQVIGLVWLVVVSLGIFDV